MNNLKQCIFFVMLFVTHFAQSQDSCLPGTAAYATGGSSAYKDQVLWLTWGGGTTTGIHNTPLTLGTKSMATFQLANQPMCFECEIINIAITTAKTPPTQLTSYKPGNWTTDSLDDMYNIGGTGTANKLISGISIIANQSQFTLKCTAKLNGVPYKIKGLVMADAESLNASGEFLKASGHGSWQIVEMSKAGSASYEVAKQTLTNKKSEIAFLKGNDAGAAAVSFLSFNDTAYNTLDNSSVEIDFSIKGNGTTAIAIGLLVPNADGGDAPISYGEVYHLIKSVNITSDGILNNNTRVNTNTSTFTSGKIIPPADLFLGSMGPDAERSMVFSSDATGDQLQGNNPNEEDAWPSDKKIIYNILPGSVIDVDVPYVSSDKNITIAGWIDFNHNGVFDASEKAAVTFDGAGVAKKRLTWTVPADFVKGRTFARLRISTSSKDVENPTGIAVDGEVEDHELYIDDPKFTISKTSNATNNIWPSSKQDKKYSITVKNIATVKSYGTVKVLDILPQGIKPNWQGSYTTNNWTLTYSGQLITATTTNIIASNATSVIEIPVLTDTNLASATYINRASVGGGGDNDYPDPVDPASCNSTSSNSHCTSYEVKILKPIVAVNDSYKVVSSTTTTQVGNIFINDLFNETAIDLTKLTFNITQPNPNVTIDPSGNVSVNAGTPSGTYILTYEICELGANPANCATAFVTVIVENQIVGIPDNDIPFSPNQTPPSVITNDTFNGNPINPQTPENPSGTVTITNVPVPQSPVVIMPNGTITVPPGTPNGNYPFEYTICEVGANPSNCKNVVGNIIVSNSVIVAVDDAYGNVNAGTTIGNILNNDTLNNLAIGTTDVTVTIHPDFTHLVSIDAAGNLTVNASTTFGAYSIPYTICEVGATPANCDTAIITFNVNDGPKTTGTTVTTFPGQPVDGSIAIVPGTGKIDKVVISNLPTDVTISNIGTDGKFTVTPGASYEGGSTFEIDYIVTDEYGLTATSKIIVNVQEVASINIIKKATLSKQTGSSQSGEQIGYTFEVKNTGNVTLNNVTVSDKMLSENVIPVTPSTLKPNEIGYAAATLVVTHLHYNQGSVTNTATSNGVSTNGTPVTDISGLTLTDDIPTVTLLTQNPEISLVKTSVFNDESSNGYAELGETITYTFVATNTGNVTLTNVNLSDLFLNTSNKQFSPSVLNPGESATMQLTYKIVQSDIDLGLIVNTAEVEAEDPQGNLVFDISGTNQNNDTPTQTQLESEPNIAIVKTAQFLDDNKDGVAQIGETILYTFSVKNTGSTTLYDIVVTDNLPGISLKGSPILILEPGEVNTTNYTATYQLTLENLKIGEVKNQATVTSKTITGITVTDDSDSTNYSGNTPTITYINGCSIEVFNALTPNGDGKNDFFYIQGIECYANNKIEIYNRWGVLVYETSGYNNQDKVFKGYSDGRATMKRNEMLPVGTYFYILKVKDMYDKSHDIQGYLYLNR